MSVNVKSQNLFNFPPRGCYDSDVAEYMAQRKLMVKQLFGEEDVSLK